MSSRNSAAFVGTLVAVVAVGAIAVAPQAGKAAIGPSEKVSIGTISKSRGTASFSARGTVDNIINNGEHFILKAWDRTFTIKPTDKTRFSPSIRDTSPTQRLAAYGIGDEVQVSGYVSSSTLTVSASSISNYTERTTGSPLYRVKAVLDGSLTSITSSTMKITAGGKTYNVIYDTTGKYYDAVKKRIKPELKGWAAGDAVYGYFMVGGTDAKAVAVYNRTKTAAAADLYTASPSTPGDTTDKPGTPTNVKATAGDRAVALTWNAVTGADRYKVLRSETSGGPYSTVTSYVTSTTYNNTGRTNGKTYYYVIVATNKAGDSANSTQVSATPSSSGGGGGGLDLPPPPGGLPGM